MILLIIKLISGFVVFSIISSIMEVIKEYALSDVDTTHHDNKKHSFYSISNQTHRDRR